MKKKYITKLFILILFLFVPLFSFKNTTEVKSIYNAVVAPILNLGGGGTGGTNNYFQNAEQITIGQSVQGSTNIPGIQYFRFSTQVSGKYKIFTSGSTDVDGVVYDNSARTIGSNKDISATDKNFCIFCDLQANTTYFVGITPGQGATLGGYTLQVVFLSQADDYGNNISSAANIELDKDIIGKIDYEGDEDYFKLVPTQSGIYSIYTTGSTDTMGGIYDGSNQLIQESDNVNGVNFKMTPKLEANKPYFIRVRHKSSTGTGAYTLRASLNNYITSNKKEFTMVIAAANLKNNSQKTVTVTYNPDELEVLDLCAVTQEKEVKIGQITGTNITINSFSPGSVIFNVNLGGTDSKIWTGPLNTIKFKSKVDHETKVIYDVQ